MQLSVKVIWQKNPVVYTTVFGEQVGSKVQMMKPAMSNAHCVTMLQKCSCQCKNFQAHSTSGNPKWLQQVYQSPLWMISSSQGLGTLTAKRATQDDPRPAHHSLIHQLQKRKLFFFTLLFKICAGPTIL